MESSAFAQLMESARLLVVSPHFDDAALSAWAVIDHPRGRAVDVITVFGGMPEPEMVTSSDLNCGFSNSTEAILTRRCEDLRALGDLVGETRYMPLVELQYDGLSHRSHASRMLVDALDSWIEKVSGGAGQTALVAIPAGAGIHVAAGPMAPSAAGSLARGGRWLAWLRALKHRMYVRRKRTAQRGGAVAHPDHLFVRDTALKLLAGRTDVSVLFYEDLPYLWSGPADEEVQRAARRVGCGLGLLSVTVDRERKQAALAHYASQLPALDPTERRLESAATLPAAERYWLLIRPQQ